MSPHHRVSRVEVRAPERNAGVAKALRKAFGAGDALPGDLARLMERLSRVR